MNYTPRYYQANAEAAIFRYFEEGSTGNPVLVLPPGTGKSVVIGSFIKNVLQKWSSQRIVMLTHVKELIAQNAEKLLRIWPEAPLGVHSAGLKSRDVAQSVIFGGVQSVCPTIKNALAKSLRHFGHRDLVIIDECHLLGPNDEAMYSVILSELKRINPDLKVIGFTATPYRLKQGLITDGGIFTDIIYDISGVDAFNRLISEGYLVPLIPKRTDAKIDVSNVDIIAGEYNMKQLAEVSNIEKLTISAINESLQIGHDRHCIMIFASNIEHCESVHAILASMGIDSVFVHSKIKKHERDERILAFKTGKVRVIIGHGILTTGFDFPPIDLIIDLAATNSPGRHVQKNGRGTRPYDGNNPDQYIPGFDYVKEYCLVLEFAGNTKRLGPINDPVIPTKAGKGGGDAPIRICDECGMYNHASVRFCECCGKEFTFETKLFAGASTEELIKTSDPIIKYFDVQKCIYGAHNKADKKPTMKVTYFCGLRVFHEWKAFEHSGYARKQACEWWRQRHDDEPPETVNEALQRTSELTTPSQIRVRLDQKHPEILGCEW